MISSGSDPSSVGFPEPGRGERLGDLVVVHRIGEQPILDGVLLDVLLDGASGLFRGGGDLVELGLLFGEVALVTMRDRRE